MEFNEFKQTYRNAVEAIHKTHVSALVASTVLADFPSRLPQETRDRVLAAMRQLHQMLGAFLTRPQTTPGEADPATVAVPDSFVDDPVVSLSLSLFVTIGTGHGDPTRIDFAPVLYAQDLVATLAHVDGFLGDSYRTACRREPRLLRRNRQITWQDAMVTGSWEALVEALIEDAVFEFGCKSIAERVDLLRRELGVELQTPEEDLGVLAEAYQLRHIIVHNGGRVSREFIARTKRTDVSLGEVCEVSSEFAGEINGKAGHLCSDVLVAIGRKFFDIAASDLTGIPLRRWPA